MAADSWRQHQRVGLVLTVVVVLAGSVVAWFVIKDRAVAEPVPPSPTVPARENDQSIVAITLPLDEPDLPPGPHRETFQVSCTICHSTRLVLNQPPFPEKKWKEVVDKMIATYKAPIGKNEAEEIVQYLHTIRGKD
jgi:hypothetical protein